MVAFAGLEMYQISWSALRARHFSNVQSRCQALLQGCTSLRAENMQIILLQSVAQHHTPARDNAMPKGFQKSSEHAPLSDMPSYQLCALKPGHVCELVCSGALLPQAASCIQLAMLQSTQCWRKNGLNADFARPISTFCCD